MSSYTPGGLSFRALTILVEHIENGNDWPIVRNDPPRNLCTHMLLERGLLRTKNSKYTTITRHGHDKFCDAMGRWADLLSRAQIEEIDRQAVKAAATSIWQFRHAITRDHGEAGEAAKQQARAGAAAVAGGSSGAVADREDQAISEERAPAL